MVTRELKKVMYVRIKYVVLLAGLCINYLNTHAQQISIQMFQTPAQFSIHDFSQTVFINTGGAQQVVVRFSVKTDIGKGILDIVTKPITFNAGANYIPQADIQMAKFEYAGNSEALQLKQSGVLPFGRYVVCAEVKDAKTYTDIATECNEQASMPYSPPMLIYPGDGEEIETPYPTLVWLSPIPDANGNIEYDMKLVEMRNNQGQYDAVQNNYTHFKTSDYGEENMNYPLDALPLKVGKWYAWKITAKYKGTDIGETEVWKFKIKEQVVDSTNKPVTKTYPVINHNLKGRRYEYSDKLYFNYNNDYRETILKYTITEYSSREQYKRIENITAKHGGNFFDIDISDRSFFKNDKLYVLEVRDEKGNIYKLQFTIKTNEK